MSVYGYIRVSSKDQKEDRQRIALKEVGVEAQNVFMDKLSGKVVLDCHNICNLPGVYHL